MENFFCPGVANPEDREAIRGEIFPKVKSFISKFKLFLKQNQTFFFFFSCFFLEIYSCAFRETGRAEIETKKTGRKYLNQ